MRVVTLAPLTVSSIGTVPGPTATAPPVAWVSAATAGVSGCWASAVAAAAAPDPYRKARREMPPPRGVPGESFMTRCPQGNEGRKAGAILNGRARQHKGLAEDVLWHFFLDSMSYVAHER